MKTAKYKPKYSSEQLNRLQNALRTAGISLRQFSKETGLSPGFLSQVLNGKEPPTPNFDAVMARLSVVGDALREPSEVSK